MKDWKAECEKLRGENAQLKRWLDSEMRERKEREQKDADRIGEARQWFKNMLMDGLGQ